MKRGIMYEYERVSDLVVSFPGTARLNMIVDLGMKGKDGNKIPLMSQFRYPSDKYKDHSTLISAKRFFLPYMCIEYQKDKNSRNKNFVYIYSYSILGLRDKMNEFDNILKKSFVKDEVDGKKHVYISSAHNKSVKCHTASTCTIEFYPDIFYDGPNKDIECPGVGMILNGEYRTVMKAVTTWRSFLYFMTCVDLYGWANTTVSGISTCAIDPEDIVQITKSEFGGGHYNDDFDDEDDGISSVKNMSKPLSNKERKQEFFRDN